jgi:hypothetical protein
VVGSPEPFHRRAAGSTNEGSGRVFGEQLSTRTAELDDLGESPCSAGVEFEKAYTNPADHTELKRERWTASVTYIFREIVRNEER